MAANSGDHERIVAVPNDASMLGPHATFFTSNFASSPRGPAATHIIMFVLA
jgi:hypothetical protein